MTAQAYDVHAPCDAVPDGGAAVCVECFGRGCAACGKQGSKMATVGKERPILFSAPMVRAILAGTKTQTRRIMKSQPEVRGECGGEPSIWWASMRLDAGYCHTNESAFKRLAEPTCPYGVPGDRLWVRETWTRQELSDGARLVWRADLAASWVDDLKMNDERIHYIEQEDAPGVWHRSIHMPRAASRIGLEIATVRVERLQDITETDARAEGMTRENVPPMLAAADRRRVWPIARNDRELFALAWDAINGKRAAWASNPWTWALTFKRVRP